METIPVDFNKNFKILIQCCLTEMLSLVRLWLLYYMIIKGVIDISVKKGLGPRAEMLKMRLPKLVKLY